MAEYTKDDLVRLYVERKIPMLVKHGVIAVYEPTARIIKLTSRGPFRTKKRRKVAPPIVGSGENGFLEAFNIIVNSFTRYKFLKGSSRNLGLTSKGRTQNKIHQRETDAKKRLALFESAIKKHFKDDIKEYRAAKEKKE